MPRIIVNSTPLIVLGNLNHLDLLHHLYGEISIPQAVFREVTTKKDSACSKIQEYPWIKVESVSNQESRRMFQAKLHDGEVEVMLLALAIPKADLVILDDNAAKKTAKFLGLKVTGTLGVLLKAKKNGLISSIKPMLNELNRINFYVSKDIQNMVLQQAGEQEQ